MENSRFRSAGRKFLAVVSGILVVLLLAEAGLRIGGIFFLSLDARRNPSKTARPYNKNDFRILCVGGCFTAGIGLTPDEAYPRQLTLLLQQRLPQRSFRVINRGARGKNLSYFVNNLGFLVARYRPQLVILNINNRVTLDDANILPANRSLLSFPDRMRIYSEVILGNFKVYRIFKLLFNKITSVPVSWESSSTRPLAAEIEIAQNRTKEKSHNPEAWLVLARAYFLQGLYSQSAESIQRAIALEPNSGWYYLDLFASYVMCKEYDRALEAQKKAFEISPQIRGVILKEIEDLKVIAEAEKKVPDKYKDKFLLSDKYASLGDYKEALREVREALSLCPFIIQYYDKVLFYKWVLGETQHGNSVPDLFEDPCQSWAFLESLGTGGRGKGLTRENSYEIFYRLMRYDLMKVAAIARKNNIRIALENLGSCPQEQPTIHQVCRELNIPLIDLFSDFRDSSRKDALFNSRLTLRLSPEGGRFMAERIFQALNERRMLDEYSR